MELDFGPRERVRARRLRKFGPAQEVSEGDIPNSSNEDYDEYATLSGPSEGSVSPDDGDES